MPGDEAGQERVSRPDRADHAGEERDAGVIDAQAAPVTQACIAAVGGLDDDVVGAELADEVGRVDDVLLVVELVTNEVFGFAQVGRDEVGVSPHAVAQRVARAVEDGLAARLADALQDLGVEVVGHLARQRAADDHVVGALGQVVDLVEQRLALLFGDHGAPLVDLGLGEARRIDHSGRGTGLPGDAHEVVQDSLAREPLDDLLPSASADQAAGDHRLADGPQGARDVDTLAAGQGEALTGPMAKAGDEVRHGQRLVDGSVGCKGDDHVARRSFSLESAPA